MQNLFSTVLQNKHTSAAGIVYFGAMGIAQIGAVWFPSHSAQFDSTAKILQGIAVAYGLLRAGDAKPGLTTTPEQANAPQK